MKNKRDQHRHSLVTNEEETIREKEEFSVFLCDEERSLEGFFSVLL
jgi:hypothetical protein